MVVGGYKKIKYLVDGSIDKIKVILVAKEYNQIEDIHYFDRYLLVSKLKW